LDVPLAELVPSLSRAAMSPRGGSLPDVEIGDRVFSPSIRALPESEGASTLIALRDVTERRETEARRLDFYSIVAHDLRSPLSAILLRADMILRGRHGVLPPKLLSDVRKMDASLKSLVGMINDFLDLARFESSGYKIVPEEVDLGELIRTTLEEFRPLLDASNLTWCCSEAGGSTRVRGDRRRLVQVVTNLVSNAIKFTPPSGTITTRLQVTSSYVEVAVQDTGHGIAPSALPMLFQRYSRATDPKHGIVGTGLGLMIVREIVEAHGGTVGVDSTPGQGSTFWFRLPPAAVAAEHSHPLM
jgi:signal transduction histidine kinase